jgi:hypothetical protein
MDKVFAFEQKRLVASLRECVGKAIAKIKAGSVAATLSIPAKRIQSRSSLFFSDWNDGEMKSEDQSLEECMLCGCSAASKYHACFQKSRG